MLILIADFPTTILIEIKPFLRLYQYTEDDIRFQFWFLLSFQTAAWIHKNMKTKRSCQLKKLLFISKKNC